MNPFRKIILIWSRFSRNMNEHHVWAYASSAAFFIFLSLIPLLMMILALIPYTPVSQDDLRAITLSIIPESFDGIVIFLINELYGKSARLVSLTAITTIWSASYGIVALTRGLNLIYETDDPTMTRNIYVYSWFRLRSCLLTISMILAIVAGLVIVVFSGDFKMLIKENLGAIYDMLRFLSSARMLISPAIMTVAFWIIYTVMPNEKIKFVPQFPGALFSAISWSVFSWGFSIYIRMFNSFSMYGSLTTIVILLLWIYFGMVVLLIGAQVNKFFYPAFKVIYNNAKNRKNQNQ